MTIELWLFGVQVMCFTEMPDEVAIHRPASPWEDDSEARG